MRAFVLASVLLCLVSVLRAAGCAAGSIQTGTDARASVASAPPSDTGAGDVYRVLSGSMEPTLPIRTTVVVRKGTPSVGDIVVAHEPEGFAVEECGPTPHVVKPGGAACDAPVPQVSRNESIKRIVAGPGDEIYVRGGHVYRKASRSGQFVRQSDSYIRACGTSSECNFPDPIRVPTGYWFLMGDNRGESDDSRYWGPISTTWIVGIAAVASVSKS